MACPDIQCSGIGEGATHKNRLAESFATADDTCPACVCAHVHAHVSIQCRQRATQHTLEAGFLTGLGIHVCA